MASIINKANNNTALILIILFAIVVVVDSSKYSKEFSDKKRTTTVTEEAAAARKLKSKEESKSKEDKLLFDAAAGNNNNDQTPFRSKKAMLIWRKAVKKHKGVASILNALREELTPIDHELMQLKKIQYENKDPYGDFEGALEQRVHALLVKFKLAGDNQLQQDPKVSNKVEDHLSKDKRLDMLYDRAVGLGFTPDELEELKAEIFHHKLKMAELDALLDKYSALEERMRVETNVVGENEGGDGHGGSNMLKELKDAIVDKKEELSESMSKLGLISENAGLYKDVMFTQTKILRLWADILQSNITEDERSSLRQELMHLENKMNKREKLASEAAQLDKHHREQGHKMDESRRNKYLEKKETIKEKSDYIDKHVNKYMKDINSRITVRRQHGEL